MPVEEMPILGRSPEASRLSPNIVALGCVSMLTAMSSAMIYGLLPVFMVTVLGISIASVGVIEGAAEAANSLVKILSGATSDWIGRRKPVVAFGYTLSAIVKTIFPVAGSASTVFVARILDRLGKGIRDAPRDAFLADLTVSELRGRGFGLRLALAVFGFVMGPLAAIGLMRSSGDDFRLVFWVALVPAYASLVVLFATVKELPIDNDDGQPPLQIRFGSIRALPAAFWWVIATANLLSLARFSQAFLVLKARDVGVDAAYVPIVLAVMYLVFSTVAYPFGLLADRLDRRLQLGLGTAVLFGADVILAGAGNIWMTGLGAALWGLQLGITQGLLAATVADAAPARLRGTAFGIFDIAVGVGTFVASLGVGALWMGSGPSVAFGFSACAALAAGLLIALRPMAGRAKSPRR
jgi:MFS family permease